MPNTAVDVGFGLTVTFATTGFTANIVGEPQFDAISRTPHETTHMGTTLAGANQVGGRTWMPGDLVEPGGMTLPIHFNPNTNPPMGAVAETITIAFPLVAGDSTRASWSVSGFIDTMGPISIPMDGVMMSTVHVKFTGLITMTDAT